MTGALDGIRVLDFTQMMLGPWGTQLLGDLGADVIKVERPEGEWERALEMMGGLTAAGSAAFLAMNRNKRSVALDLKDPCARQALLKLGATCDVVVENFRPGVMARLGLAYEDFRALKPDIVYCSGSGWGQDTSFARENRPGQDLLIQAMSGLAGNGGRREDPPTPAGTAVVDASTALSLASGILAALLAKERQGIGQRVEVDLYSTAIALQCQEISAMLNQDATWERSRAGIAQPWLSAPYGIYRTADGWLALAMSPMPRLADVLTLPRIAELDPWAARDEIKVELDALIATRPTQGWLDLLLPEGLWASPVRTTKEAVDELSSADGADGTDLLVTVDHPDAGELRLVGCHIRLSETPWQLRAAPPRVGEHTQEVLSEVLSEAELATLLHAGD
ncbi:CaiB/BaiF CoA transferase family protein [Wenjunlia tyrosinilytica]|uniref:CoA transferase n=1 Tax=Wenjunlia tyrosinilytica TaxID=1544741 RepID=A0A917ZVR8_9ACTN|nr:CoA transferase [Wenjunlia tyrosinilytica]GGO94408.1 CoA transferase [Wenjunlia tyrosinilytica]